jgi:hypothetical protein
MSPPWPEAGKLGKKLAHQKKMLEGAVVSDYKRVGSANIK